LTGELPVRIVNHIVQPAAGALDLLGYAPSIPGTGITVEPLAGTLTFTGETPSAEIDHFRAVDTVSLVLTGEVPDLLENHIAVPFAERMILTGIAPSAEIDHFKTNATASLVIASDVVTLNITLLRDPAAGALTLTGPAPSSVEQSIRTPGSGSLTLAGITPVSTVTHPTAPSVGTLTLTGYAPILGIGVSVPAATLTATGLLPTTREPVHAATLAFSSEASLINVANSGVDIANPDADETPSNYEICDYTGFKVKAGELVQTGYGFWTRPESYEGRHPQEFVRSRVDKMTGPQSPEPDDVFATTVAAEDL
jgi:hypothetical protein